MTRQQLPNRRLNQTTTFEQDGLIYLLTVGYQNNTEPLIPLELFLNTSMKVSNAADIAVSDAAVAVSLALQYGCPLDTLAGAMKRNPEGLAMGVIGRALDLILEMGHER